MKFIFNTKNYSTQTNKFASDFSQTFLNIYCFLLKNELGRRCENHKRLKLLARFHTFAQINRKRRAFYADIKSEIPSWSLDTIQKWTKWFIDFNKPAFSHAHQSAGAAAVEIYPLENSILGCLLRNSSLADAKQKLETITSIFTPSDFQYAKVFEACQSLILSNEIPYPVNVNKELGNVAEKLLTNFLECANKTGAGSDNLHQYCVDLKRDLLEQKKSLLYQKQATSSQIKEVEDQLKNLNTGANAEFEEFLRTPPAPLERKIESPGEVVPNMIPSSCRDWILDIADRAQIHATFSATALISYISMIIARRINIYPKKFDTEWRVIPNIWGGIVGPPGIGKTPAINPILEPIKKYNKELRKQYERELTEYQRDLAEWKQDKTGEPPKEPVQRMLYATDPTEAALQKALANNPQGLGVFRDELSGLIDSFSKKGNEGTRQFYLEGWNGNGDISSLRISRDNVNIDEFCLTLFGGIQPSVLNNYVKKSAKNSYDDGFIQRFQLLVQSVPPQDYKLVDREPNWEAKARFENAFNRLLDLPMTGDPVAVRFSDEAQPVFFEWLEQLERRLRSGQLNNIMASHLSKYRSLLPSIALVIEALDNDEFSRETIVQQDLLPSVSLGSLEKALMWVEFLEIHAFKLLTDNDTTVLPETELAIKILDKFKSDSLIPIPDDPNHKGPKPLRADGSNTLRDVRRKFSSNITKEVWGNAIELLVQTGWLYIERQKTGGRYRENVRVHSSLFEVPKVPKGENTSHVEEINQTKTSGYVDTSQTKPNAPKGNKNAPKVVKKNGKNISKKLISSNSTPFVTGENDLDRQKFVFTDIHRAIIHLIDENVKQWEMIYNRLQPKWGSAAVNGAKSQLIEAGFCRYHEFDDLLTIRN